MQVAINCEMFRLYRAVGYRRGEALIHAAFEMAYVSSDDSARHRVDSMLQGRMFQADDPACDSLANAGLLGGKEYLRGPVPP
jgi:hypothetical protein